MIQHIVVFKLKPETTPEQEETLISMLQGLKEKVPSVVELTAGKTFVPKRGQGFTIALVAVFKDKEGLNAYGPHPAHMAVVEYIGPITESAVVVDYEF